MPDYFYVMSGTIRGQQGNQVFDTNGIVDVQPGMKRSDIFDSVLGKVTAAAGGIKPTVGFWSLEENEFEVEPVEDMAAVDQDEAGL